MPSSKIVPVKQDGVEPVLRYLANPAAESHREYYLTLLRVEGVETPALFTQTCELRIQRHHERELHGRPSVTAAYWYIVRYPDGSWLKPSERRFCMRSLIREACLGQLPAAFNEHRNRIFGSQDFNVLIPAFDEFGQATRSSLFHPVRELRARMDDVVTIMNAHRRETDASVIPEMKCIRSERCRKTPDVVKILGALPRPPGNHDELLAALWSMGWETKMIGKRKKRLRISDEKKAWQREIDANALLVLIVRWRLARVNQIMLREKMAALEAEKPTTVGGGFPDPEKP